MESKIVKALAGCPSVERSASEPCSSDPYTFRINDLITEIELDEVLRSPHQHDANMVASKWKELVETIKSHMSRSTSVVVRGGWAPQLSLEFSKVSVAMQFGGDVGFRCQWVDGFILAANRDREKHLENYHKTTTMARFIEQVEDTSVCGNFLDGKDMNQTPPLWAKPVFDSATAWGHTVHLRWLKGADEHGAPEFEENPPTAIRSETWTSQGWKLVTHPGYVTIPHHDCCGMGTYVIGNVGSKVWAVVRPKRRACATLMKDLHACMSNAMDLSEDGDFSNADVATVCLGEGDVM